MNIVLKVCAGIAFVCAAFAVIGVIYVIALLFGWFFAYSLEL